MDNIEIHKRYNYEKRCFEDICQWIKVKEKKPDICNVTILLSDGFEVYPGFFDSELQFRFNGQDVCEDQDFDVIYWMELPSPPLLEK